MGMLAAWARRSGAARSGPGGPTPVADRPRPVDEATVWALAAASCGAVGAYMPLEFWQWAMAEPEQELLLLRRTVLVLATVEDGSLVLDFLFQKGTGGHELWAPFTIRACRQGRRRTTRVPSPLRRWARSGKPLELSLRDRNGARVARIFGPHSEFAVDVESVAPELVPLRQ